jgi:hypothetical protein
MGLGCQAINSGVMNGGHKLEGRGSEGVAGLLLCRRDGQKQMLTTLVGSRKVRFVTGR